MEGLSPLRKTLVGLAIAAGVVFFVWTAVNSFTTAYQSVQNLAHADMKERIIYSACKQYAGEHGGNFPPSLDALFPAYLSDRSALVSPLKPDEPLGYLYTPPPAAKLKSPDFVVLEDKFAPTLIQRRICCYADGHVRVVPNP